MHLSSKLSGMFASAEQAGRVLAGEIILTNLSIAVSAHLGPGTVGIVAYPVNEDV
jgi:fatty acid-binding protein DegV